MSLGPNEKLIGQGFAGDLATPALLLDLDRFEATDADPPLLLDKPAEFATYRFMGDEHGALYYAASSGRPALGDLVRLVAPHCDPTVNLHDRLHVVRGRTLVDIWPIAARGY